MFKNSLKYILIIILILFTLTGCWDSYDIQDKDIASVISADYKDGEYYFCSEIANIVSNSSNQVGSPKFQMLSAKGKTYEEVRDSIDRITGQPVFLGATRVLLFTNRLAEDIGIEEYVNRLRGQLEYRKSINIITTNEEPENILNFKPANSLSVGFSIEEDLLSLQENGTDFRFTFGDVLHVLSVKKAGFLLPEFNLDDDHLKFTGYSVFKDARRIGEIDAKNRNGIVYLLSPNANFIYTINYKFQKFFISTEITDKKIKTEYNGDQVNFDINLKLKSKITYSNKMIPISKDDTKEIEKLLEKEIKKDVEDAIKTSQNKYKCDYLNFYKYFNAKYHKDFKTIDWCKAYSEAKMNVSVKTKMVSNIIPKK